MSITSENTYEIQILKKELGIAIVRNGEMRARSEQAATREFYSSTSEIAPKEYQPLGKVLNMKFYSW